MKKEKTYNLNESDLKQIVAMIVMKFLLGMIKKESEALNPDTVLQDVLEFLDSK